MGREAATDYIIAACPLRGVGALEAVKQVTTQFKPFLLIGVRLPNV